MELLVIRSLVLIWSLVIRLRRRPRALPVGAPLEFVFEGVS